MLRFMGNVHDYLEAKGKQETLQLQEFTRDVVEAASAYMADEDTGIGFLYSGWCQAALPHRRLPNDQGWQIDGDRVRLIVEPGMRGGNAGKPELVGIPFGSRARLILLRLQSEALRTNCREVELGKSLRDWLHRMGIPVGGRSLKDVRDQTERISRCRLTFEVRQGSRVGMTNQSITESAIFLESEDPSQGQLFAQYATLSTAFFEALKRHPVPIEESAIRAIANNSMALDVYAWLAYRLHVLAKPTPLSWRALKQQFGAGFNRIDNFKTTFLSNLRLALAVYREAKVEGAQDGLILHPSPPPVAPRVVAVRLPSRV
jgi:Plasmid encoded RepA protein